MGKYLEQYGDKVVKHQQGGAMTQTPAMPETPATDEQNMVQQIMMMAQDALTTNDGNKALEVCRQLVSMATPSQKNGGKMMKKVKVMKYKK